MTNINVSLDAARRQAFGVKFDNTAADASIVADLLAGRLELSPHRTWQIPAEIDWLANPFTDLNWQSQFHMLRWMDPLRRQADKGDPNAAATWLNYAESWVRANPSSEPLWPRAWADMVDGIRALELCVALPFVNQVAPEALAWLIPSIQEHAEWLANEANLGHSNHALHQHQGLFVCGAVLRDENWMSLAERRMESLFASAYDDEGVNAEGAISYHLANYNWWIAARRRLQAEGRIVPEAMRLLDQVPIELAHATKPDGRLVSIGDTDGGSVRAIDHPATRWVGTAGADGEAPEDLIKVYKAGYVFARSGWGDQERNYSDETFFSVSFGAANRVHGHPDGGSVTFSSMGHEWISDPGKYQYGSSPMRAYCLNRRSHSLPYVLGAAYDATTEVACIKQDLSDATYDLTFEDRGYDGVVLTRRIVYSVSGEYVVVVDTVVANGECTVVQNWQTGKATRAVKGNRGFSLTAGGKRAVVQFAGSAPKMTMATGKDDPPVGWVSTGWKQRDAAPTLRFTKTGRRFRFITVLAAGYKSVEPLIETVRDVLPGEIRLRIDTGRVAEQIVITRDASAVVPYSEEPRASSSTASSTVRSAALFDPLDSEQRGRVLDAVERTRADAWHFEDPASRAASSVSLQLLKAEFHFPDGTDLGLEATLSDVRSVVHKRTSPREIRRDRAGLINWADDPGFRPTMYNTPIVTLRGADAPLPDISSDTLLTYSLESLVVPAMVSPADGDTLTVLFQGAVDRARTQLPLFQRFRFQKELGAGPTVAFSDPTLDLSRELRLGWYLGNERIDLAPRIAAAVQRLARKFGVSKIVLQGGSGGGFAALQVGAHIDGAHVVALNPQTDLRRYSVTSYRAACIAALGLKDANIAPSMHPRISVLERMRALGAQVDVTLVMNAGDVAHERNHAAPLRAFYSAGNRGSLVDVSYDLGPGHRGLDNDQYREVMDAVYEQLGSARSTIDA